MAHATLKARQKILASQDILDAQGRDAVGNVVIALIGYCGARGWSLSKCVAIAWDIVKNAHAKE